MTARDWIPVALDLPAPGVWVLAYRVGALTPFVARTALGYLGTHNWLTYEGESASPSHWMPIILPSGAEPRVAP